MTKSQAGALTGLRPRRFKSPFQPDVRRCEADRQRRCPDENADKAPGQLAADRAQEIEPDIEMENVFKPGVSAIPLSEFDCKT
ncbi:MAG: hypothetical protein M8364_11120 [Methylobacter sp.]|uniref:hypothetical protein n=1 Tax=Methylobacter sp. TaxID=2051955 RepID=UPI0025886FF6|nr:hypothetical protein [Methylobacter sp.]MCL7421442.1 hypothetical protein [Methylobacter sp.]